MPEGDTIFRTATTLQRWIGGRTITAASTSVRALDVSPLVGSVVGEVSAVGKHLFITFLPPVSAASTSPAGQSMPTVGDQDGPVATSAQTSPATSAQTARPKFALPYPLTFPLTLRTHQRMTGSWHVYRAGEEWQRPAHQSTVVLTAGDRVAVCFNTPIVQLTSEASSVPRAVRHLGPDILQSPFDASAVAARAHHDYARVPVGEAILDQRLVAGIGNVYRCEGLFVVGLNPRTPCSAIQPDQLAELLRRVEQMMVASAGTTDGRRDTEGGPDRPWVYARSSRPCRRCSATIRSEQLGVHGRPRTVYWCPVCQQ